MIPIAAVKYTFISAVLVISFFLGVRMISARDTSREDWRSIVKHYIYFTQAGFRKATLVSGWILIFISLVVACFSVIDLMN